MPDLLHKTFEAIRKYDKQQKIILKDSPTFFSEKKARSEIKSKALFESEISKTKDNTSFQFQKLNEVIILLIKLYLKNIHK